MPAKRIGLRLRPQSGSESARDLELLSLDTACMCQQSWLLSGAYTAAGSAMSDMLTYHKGHVASQAMNTCWRADLQRVPHCGLLLRRRMLGRSRSDLERQGSDLRQTCPGPVDGLRSLVVQLAQESTIRRATNEGNSRRT